MVDGISQIVRFGGVLTSVSNTVPEVIISQLLPIGRNVYLEFLKYGVSANNYELYEIRFNGATLHQERLRVDNQTLRVGLPWYRLIPPGRLELLVTPGAAGRTYTANLYGVSRAN